MVSVTPLLRARPALPEEAPMLCELALRSKAHWGYPSKLMDAWRERCPVNVAYLATHQVHVFERGAAVAGFFSFARRDGRVWLEDFWLDPAWIGRGLGRQMWHAAIDIAGQSGNGSLEIEADPNAAGFYEAMGAQRIGAISSPLDPRRLLPVLRFHLPRSTPASAALTPGAELGARHPPKPLMR